MAETKKTDKVTITLPRAAAYQEPQLFVGVNGVNYIIPRGVKTTVPREVAAEIERAEKAEMRYFSAAAEKAAAATESAKQAGL